MNVRPKISYNRILLWYYLQGQVGLPHAICQQLLGKNKTAVILQDLGLSIKEIVN